MREERKGTPLYKIVAFVASGLVVVAAVLLFMAFGPSLRQPPPTAQLRATLAQHFPGSKPEVTQPGPDALRVVLKVGFDPTVDAELAQDVFERTREVVRAQDLEGLHRIEIELQGTSLEGGATAASRTFEMTVTGRSQEPGVRRTTRANPNGTSLTSC